jgi:hypothetical protein
MEATTIFVFGILTLFFCIYTITHIVSFIKDLKDIFE